MHFSESSILQLLSSWRASFRTVNVLGKETPPSFCRPSAQGTLFLSFVLLATLMLSGCVATIPAAQSAEAAPGAANGERLADIADYNLPTPPPVIVPDLSAIIITEDARANVRSGPAIDAPIVAKANPGDSFQVTGKSDDNLWWQICCVPNPTAAAGSNADERAWVSSEVVQIDGNVDAVPVVNALLPETLNASWQVDWSCGSERCEVKLCTGTITAESNGDSTQQWLQVEHNVNWDEDCFENDTWVFEVDRFSGEERSGSFVEDFRYNYWLGSQPGPPTNVFTLDNGRQVAVWCSTGQEFDVPVGDGWTNAVSGSTCHDVRTGELVYITYVTRWLFTGEYDGQRYERAYFGDYETLEQYLVDTNAELFYLP
jgi:hypothetical protein